jgi:hypothetical protein
MSIFQDFKTISFELDVAVKIQRLKGIDRYLVHPFVLVPVQSFEEVQVGLNGSARELDFLVLAGCEA